MALRSLVRIGRNDADNPVRRVCENRNRFEDAVVKAQTAQGWKYDEQLVEKTRAEFRQMERLAERLHATGDAFAEDEVWKLKALSRRRVYILPDTYLESEASILYEEMRDWNVPASALAALQVLRERVGTNRDRAALHRLLEEYAYWDRYIEWYNGVSTAFRGWLLAIGVVLFVAALVLGWGVWAPFLACGLASAAGAVLSVGFKVPPPTSYGEATTLFNGIVFVRVLSGTVTSMVTVILLAGGVVNVSIGQTPLREIVHHCIDRKAAEQQTKKAEDAKTQADDDAKKRTDELVKAAAEKLNAEKDATDHENDPAAAKKLAEATNRATKAEAAAASAKTAADEKTRALEQANDSACTAPNLCLLLCIALLLGFSERTLSGLLGQVFGGDSSAAPPTAAPRPLPPSSDRNEQPGTGKNGDKTNAPGANGGTNGGPPK